MCPTNFYHSHMQQSVASGRCNKALIGDDVDQLPFSVRWADGLSTTSFVPPSSCPRSAGCNRRPSGEAHRRPRPCGRRSPGHGRADRMDSVISRLFDSIGPQPNPEQWSFLLYLHHPRPPSAPPGVRIGGGGGDGVVPPLPAFFVGESAHRSPIRQPNNLPLHLRSHLALSNHDTDHFQGTRSLTLVPPSTQILHAS